MFMFNDKNPNDPRNNRDARDSLKDEIEKEIFGIDAQKNSAKERSFYDNLEETLKQEEENARWRAQEKGDESDAEDDYESEDDYSEEFSDEEENDSVSDWWDEFHEMD